jgi:RHS repeat-associated protein
VFYWVHQNHLGSGHFLTTQSGNVAYRGEYDPHGETIFESAPAGSFINSKKFTGYERNWATGLDYAKARNYQRTRGRFTSPDPLSVAAADVTNPQSFNRYAYVGNDPINYVDPTGLYLEAVCWDVTTYSWGPEGSITNSSTYCMIINVGGGGGAIGGGPIGGGPVDGGGGNGTGTAPQNVTPDNLTSNQDALKALYCLWKKGGYGVPNTERSMWITQNEGKYGTVQWPWSAENKTESWKGPIPTGTVANAHTHPNSASPKPSTTGGNTGKGDHGTADKIRLPVYTVTRDAIWKAVPGTKEPTQVVGKDWWKTFDKEKVKCD